MRVKLVQPIKYDMSFIYLEKIYSSDFVPRTGDFIIDPAFDKEHKVGSVIIDLDTQTCKVILQELVLNMDYSTAIKHVEEKYGDFNWQRVS